MGGATPHGPGTRAQMMPSEAFLVREMNTSQGAGPTHYAAETYCSSFLLFLPKQKLDHHLKSGNHCFTHSPLNFPPISVMGKLCPNSSSCPSPQPTGAAREWNLLAPYAGLLQLQFGETHTALED